MAQTSDRNSEKTLYIDDGKDLSIIKNLCLEQKAADSIEGQLGKFIKTERGTRQGCVLSGDLLLLYSEQITRTIVSLNVKETVTMPLVRKFNNMQSVCQQCPFEQVKKVKYMYLELSESKDRHVLDEIKTRTVKSNF